MNRAEYADYKNRVESFYTMEGIDNLSPDTHGEYGEWVVDEFSSQPCECCQRHWAGARVECSGYNQTTKEVQGPYSVCHDCVYYCAYGKLDDMTMSEVERDEESEERR